MQLLEPHEYKTIIQKQGRNMSWVSRQLDCSYSLLYQFLKGDKPMKKERIEKLHNVLGLD